MRSASTLDARAAASKTRELRGAGSSSVLNRIDAVLEVHDIPARAATFSVL